MPRRRAPLHHLAERHVAGHAQRARPRGLAQRPRHVDPVGEEHHPRIRAPPEHRILVVEPREDATAIRVEQARHRQVVAGRQEPVRFRERPFHGRERIARFEPWDHESVHAAEAPRDRGLLVSARPSPAGCRDRRSPGLPHRPTGYLHLGHVVNAIFVWGVARAAGGRVLLRIEDHDRCAAGPGSNQRAWRISPGWASSPTKA